MATASITRFQSEDHLLAQAGNPPLDQILALLTGRPEVANRRLREKIWENIEKASELLEECAEKIEEGSEDRDAREHLILAGQFTAISSKVVDMYHSLALTNEIAGVGVRRLAGDDATELRSANRRRLKPPVIREAEIS